MTSKTERAIHGIASSERLIDHSRANDGSDYSVMLRGCCALATPVPLLLEHGDDPIGTVNYFRWLNGGKLYVRARVHDTAGGQQAWKKIERIELRGLSCGFTRHNYQIELRKEGVVKFFDRYTITEISIVHTPLNPDCFFRIYSGGFEGRVEGQLSLSEHRQINDRARALIARLEKKYPTQPSRRIVSKTKSTPGPGLSPDELRRVKAWIRSELGDEHGK
jgi:Caudovirus prohead serine protease